ncbi:hypothetical protein HDU98_010184, partial [Podochytrium sp. JEL0797]
THPDLKKHPNRALSVVSVIAFTHNLQLGYMQRLLSTCLKGDDASQLLIEICSQLGFGLSYTATKINIGKLVDDAEAAIERVCKPLLIGWVQDNVEEYHEVKGTLEKSSELYSRTNTSKIYFVGDIPDFPSIPAIPLSELKPFHILPNAQTLSNYKERQRCMIANILIQNLPEFKDIALKRPSCGTSRVPIRNDLIPTGLLDFKQGTLDGMAQILDHYIKTHAIPTKGSSEASAAGFDNMSIEQLLFGDLGLFAIMESAKGARLPEIGSSDVERFCWAHFGMGEFHVKMALIERFYKIFLYNGLKDHGTLGDLGRIRDRRFQHDSHEKFTFYEKERLVEDVCEMYVAISREECCAAVGDSGLELAAKLDEVVDRIITLVEEHEQDVTILSEAVLKRGKNKDGKTKLETVVCRTKPASKRAYVLEFIRFGVQYLVFNDCISTGDGDGVVEMHMLFLLLLKEGGMAQSSRYFNAFLHEQVQLQSLLRQDIAYRSKYFRFVNPSGLWNSYFAVDQRQEHFNKHLKECKGIKHTDDYETAYARSLAANCMFKAKQQMANGLGITMKNGYHPPPKSTFDLDIFYRNLKEFNILSDVPNEQFEALLVSEAQMDLHEEALHVIQTVQNRCGGIFDDESSESEGSDVATEDK